MVYTIPKLVLFGDSITQHANDQVGFALAPALQSHYARKMDIVTRGFSGYNTNHAVYTLPEVLDADNAKSGIIKLIVIFMGTNDAAFNFQGVPIDTYKANLQKLIDLAKSYNIKVILVGPTLHGRAECIAASESQGLDPNFSDTIATRKYADVAAGVAAASGVPFLDLWYVFQKYGGWSTDDLIANKVPLGELLPDGIHFSPKAYEIYYNELINVIGKSYPELKAEELPLYFPSYDGVDFDHMEESINNYVKKHST